MACIDEVPASTLDGWQEKYSCMHSQPISESALPKKWWVEFLKKQPKQLCETLSGAGAQAVQFEPIVYTTTVCPFSNENMPFETSFTDSKRGYKKLKASMDDVLTSHA